MSTNPDIGSIPERTLRTAFIWLSHRKALGRVSTRVPITRPMVRRFIAGESLDEVMPVLDVLSHAGFLTTVDVLGESVETSDACGAAAGRYVETIEALAARGLDRNVSLKLTQMGLDIDRDLCRETVAVVFRSAAQHGAFVRIDMEDHTKTDATLDLWRDLRSINPDSGVVIQAALRRSSGDVETLIREGARVRLCKGAYNEPAAVALRDRDEVDAAFERQARRLMADGDHPALATHDARLIGRLVRWADREGIPRDRYEFQMLHGIRRDLQAQLLGKGFRVRVYVPYGTQWYPYFMRRLAERPANVTSILRSLMKEGTGGAAKG
jgi:proline dehydrogenase